MAINDLPILSALRTKMQWHQERQRVLAENVSSANTPSLRPIDLVEPKFDNKGANLGGAVMEPHRRPLADRPALAVQHAQTCIDSIGRCM